MTSKELFALLNEKGIDVHTMALIKDVMKAGYNAGYNKAIEDMKAYKQRFYAQRTNELNKPNVVYR